MIPAARFDAPADLVRFAPDQRPPAQRGHRNIISVAFRADLLENGPQTLIGIFRNDTAVIAVGIVALRWQISTLPLNSFIMTSNMLTQTCRMPVAANLLASARSGLFFVPLILVLSHFFGLMGVEMCQAVSDICSFSLTVPVMAHTLKRLKQ